MELSRPIPRPHMAVTLPEILREITSFLPNYDLHKSVTLVSRGWEDAARKRLLSRVCVNLTPENVAGYLEATKIRGKHHKHVFLRDFNFENLSREESKKLENFNFTATTPINKLRLDYFPYGWFIHPRVVTLFSHCPRLESVTFSPKTLRTQTLKSSPPKDVSFPKVVAFEISLASDYSEFEEVMRSIKLPDFLGIISIFPNLKILRCTALSQNIMEYFLSDKTSIREISVRLRNTDPLISIQNRSIFLTGIEFLVGIAANSRNYDVILAIFADQLEKLKLVAEYNLPRRLFELADVQVLVTINLPKVLPRLKCLEIGIVREASFGNKMERVPGLHLNFGGYSLQVPVLEKLVVAELDECEPRYRDPNDLEEGQEWFELCAGFFSRYFLLGECQTVREVTFPLPPGKRVGFKLFQKLGGGRNNVISELVDCSDFYERIVTTFPNLRWEMFEGVDPERVEEWVRIGSEIGLLTKEKLKLK